MLIIAQVLRVNGLKMTVFAHSQTTNKVVNEAANDSARVSVAWDHALSLLSLYVSFALPAGMWFSKRNENRAWSQVRQDRKIPGRINVLLSEPIRLQDLEDSARSQAWKK